MNYLILYILLIPTLHPLKADKTFMNEVLYQKHTIQVSGISYNGVLLLPSIGVISKASARISVKEKMSLKNNEIYVSLSPTSPFFDAETTAISNAAAMLLLKAKPCN